LLPLLEEIPFLVEDLDAAVAAVADEQPPPGIQGDGVRRVELAGGVPFLPQVLMNLPSFENFTMRALESPPCPSATKMSPFEAVVMSDGRLKMSGPSPATPALPRVSKTFPFALNLTTWWPFPSFPSASVTQTLLSRSTWMP